MQKELFNEMICLQEEKVFKLAQKIIPNITREDVLQPNDFLDLENNPYFRYEEGVLEGIRSVKAAFLADESCR